ncbi:hypothetical protein CK203_068061 [Vitis vinifera]|nr:hypothetical protein CK203_068061 [Vitis vinifera]
MFSAGNTQHAELEEVYRILKDLGLQMEVEGYIPDIDEEQRSILLGYR